jgi:hypothetical protein
LLKPAINGSRKLKKWCCCFGELSPDPSLSLSNACSRGLLHGG